jgi:hypothetical protein
MKTNESPARTASVFTRPDAAPAQIRSYAELQERIHEDLRAQHPEWVEPSGKCPTCDSYERRLAELITLFRSAERDLVAA